MEEREQESAINGSDEEQFKAPKSLLFSVLSILWIFPSLTAIWLIARDFSAVRNAHNLGELFSAIRLEQWVGIILLFAHALFIFLTIRCRRRERGKI